MAQVAVAISSSLGRGTRQAAELWQRGQWGLAGLVPSGLHTGRLEAWPGWALRVAAAISLEHLTPTE